MRQKQSVTSVDKAAIFCSNKNKLELPGGDHLTKMLLARSIRDFLVRTPIYAMHELLLHILDERV